MLSRRLLWIGLGGLFAIALFRPLTGFAPAKGDAVAAGADPPGVRIEHELVAASVVQEPAPRQAERPPAGEAPRPDTRTDGFLSKARRAILGDGRHRPEPFPRAGR